jgi:hypothetical protein
LWARWFKAEHDAQLQSIEAHLDGQYNDDDDSERYEEEEVLEHIATAKEEPE